MEKSTSLSRRLSSAIWVQAQLQGSCLYCLQLTFLRGSPRWAQQLGSGGVVLPPPRGSTRRPLRT